MELTVTLMIAVVCACALRQSQSAAAEDHPWVVLDGAEGPGSGKNIVLIAADDEYRSEELIPQLAKILAVRHGFRCTVLFAADPETGLITPGCKENIPGLEWLASADLMVLFARLRTLPDEQMKHLVDYTNSGKPIIGLRTTTHAFRYAPDSDSPYAKYDCRSNDPEGGWGRAVLGETWAGHHGHHNHESTRGLVAEGLGDHPLVRGVDDVWGPSDVYTITTLSGDSRPVIMGQVLSGMNPTDPPNPEKAQMPVAWIKTYTGETGNTARVFATTMGHGGDFLSEGFRRLLVNGCYWALGLEDLIPAKSDVAFVGAYEPTEIGVNKHRQGLRAADHRLPESLVD